MSWIFLPLSQSADWSPADSRWRPLADVPVMAADTAELWTLLHSAWQRDVVAPSIPRGMSRRAAEQDWNWFWEQAAHGAVWSKGHQLPPQTRVQVDCRDDWPASPSVVELGLPPDAWVWWPRGIPAGRRVGIVSSHTQSRRLGATPLTWRRTGHFAILQPWLRTLRVACLNALADDALVMLGDDTTTGPWIRRYAQHLGLRTIRLLPTSPRPGCTSIVDWLRQVRRHWERVESVLEYPACLFPGASLLAPDRRQALAPLPSVDATIVAGTDQLRVLALREHGNMLRLVENRISAETELLGDVWLAVGPGLVDCEIAAPLFAKGAVAWYVREPPRQMSAAPRLTSSAAGTIWNQPCVDEADFLVHCTRSSLGPWPDETEIAYLDHFLASSGQADHSALATLWRIVRQRRLLATSRTIRGGLSVVSFTSVPPSRLSTLRVFRSHRHRWDFEPYGIAIRRDWLIARGVRPVWYASDADWEQLPLLSRPYFQRATTRGRRDRAKIDWTVEQEWRHWGDLSLEELGPRDGFVIVPTQSVAQDIAPMSPWPVLALGIRSERDRDLGTGIPADAF